MIFFITFLRALAACLITNAHYTGIYPTDIIANGGLLGDVIFFAVSGYCLYNARHSFPRWYGKRLVRCYLPVILITALYMIIGAYSLADNSLFWWFVYPTNYHFVASIVLLYIPYYIVIKFDVLKKNIPWIMVGVGLIFVIVYIVFYDKSYYHIDTVREPMIRFLFFESMLLGAYFRQNNEKHRNKFAWWIPVFAFIAFVLYFASKLLFSRKESLASLQIINQIILFVLLYLVFRLFSSIDGKLEKLPGWIKAVITFISEITLEIYVVQYVLIDAIRPLMGFPLNWVVLTASILASATVLHYVCKGILWLFDILVNSIGNSIAKKSEEQK